MHVVKLFEIPDDPLDNPIPQGAVSIVKGWVCMYGVARERDPRAVHNPGQGSFSTTAQPTHMEASHVLIHIALAWPASYAAGNPKLETIEGEQSNFIMYNSDIHSENVMFGHYSSDDMLEHEIAPILKMINLGGIEMRATPTVYAWDAAIKKLLSSLPQIIEPLLFACRNPDIPLNMGSVNMDPMCLRYMEQAAMGAIRARTAAWYGDNMPNSNLDETDEAVLRMVRELIFESRKPDEPVADVVQALEPGTPQLN
ncbi:hypothetical protein PG996_005778 [Apiospora saccharicola]|uniref:Uncharacterized protein n=1 Tax=Apiospora saccharicola TaxID=335842 RepID=A0ABR1VME5_9PEZI